MEIFSSPNRPFYHSSKMFPLADIDRTGAQYLVDKADGNVFYVQKLAHVAWNLAREENTKVLKEVINSAFKVVINESRDYFYSLCELLTPHQLGALKVAAHLGEGEKIFSKDFLKDHNWQRDSLKQAIDALVDKDLVSHENGVYKVEDVFFQKLARLSMTIFVRAIILAPIIVSGH